MLAQLSMWIMLATLGQAPAEATATAPWLKAIPADVDLVIRSRGLEPTFRDLTDLVKAMSPRGAEMAVPALSNLLTQFQNQHGAEAVKTPWVSLVRVVPPGPDGLIPFAVLILRDDYRGVLKSLAGGKEVVLKPQDGGIDSFDNPHGNGVWYAVKGTGFAAFGPDKEMIAAIAKPGDKTLDKVLTPALVKPFLTADLGLFVNAAQLSTRYADQIQQARQALMTGLDQAAQKAPNGPSMEAVKDMYGRLFDSLKNAGSLTLGLDFAAEGFQLAGQLDLKAGFDASKAIVLSKQGAADLGRFPPDAAFYLAMNMDAKDLEKWQNMSMPMLNPSGKFSPEQTRAMEQFHKLGSIETLGSVSFEKGIRAFNIINVSDPKAYNAAMESMLLAMTKGDSPLNVYKDVKIEHNVLTYQGLTLSHLVATIDEEKVAKLGAPNNAGGVAGLKAMFGGDVLSYWIGTDGKRVVQITTPTWDEAKAQLDAYAKGDSGIGNVPTYRYVRTALADQANLLVIANAQGLVRMFAKQMGAALNKPELKVPAGLPEEPALFGFSLTPRQPAGYEFHFVLPSQVGPVFENGMIPIFQNMQPKVNQ